MSRRRRVKDKRFPYSILSILILFVCGLVTLQKFDLMDTVERDQKKLEVLSHEKEELIKEQEEISDYSSYVKTKKYIEEVAREKLGLVYKDEIIFKAEE